MYEALRRHVPVAAAIVLTAAVTATAPVIAATHGGAAKSTAPTVKASMARTTVAVDNFDTCAFTTIFSDIVNVPAAGFLEVWGSVSASRDTDNPNPAVLTTRIMVGAKPATIETSAHLVDDGTDDNNISMSGGVPVSKGAKTVAIQAYECTSGAAYIDSQSLSALYVKNGVSHVVTKRASKSAHQNS